MALTPTTFAPLSAMANSNALRMFCYKTTEAKAAVVASGYFDNAVKAGLKLQDVIWVLGVTGGVEVLFVCTVDAISAAGVVTTLSSSLTLA